MISDHDLRKVLIQMFDRTSKEHGVKTRPHNGTHTHRAGFSRGVEIMMTSHFPERNPLALQGCGEVDDGSDLAMKNGIGGTMIAGFGNELIRLAVDDQSAKGYTARALFWRYRRLLPGTILQSCTAIRLRELDQFPHVRSGVWIVRSSPLHVLLEI